LKRVGEIVIPRPVRTGKPISTELHLFCDGSGIAFGAVAYQVFDYGTHKESAFILSKKKCNSLRKRSIPQVELLSAVVSSRMFYTLNGLVQFDEVYYWSDSLCTLYWIKKEGQRYGVFVMNRITEINDLTEPQHWRHVPTEDNPADKVTRGLSFDKFKVDKVWQCGPEWLLKQKDWWPKTSMVLSKEEQDTIDESVQRFAIMMATTRSKTNPEKEKPSYAEDIGSLWEEPMDSQDPMDQDRTILEVGSGSIVNDTVGTSTSTGEGQTEDQKVEPKVQGKIKPEGFVAEEGGSIEWHEDQAQALKEAREQHPILSLKFKGLKSADTWTSKAQSLARLRRTIRTFKPEDKSYKVDEETPLENWEVEQAKTVLIKWEQAKHFADEIRKCSVEQGWPIGELAKVDALFDDQGVLRANGRLDLVKGLPIDEKRPIVLHDRSDITTLIIMDAHEQLGHQDSPTQVMAFIRKKYWILHLRRVVKTTLKKCLPCQISTRKRASQHMAKLPKDLVSYEHLAIFEHIAMDYAGPLMVKVGPKSATLQKHWILVFVCLQTKAFHAELVEHINTDHLLTAMARFTLRYRTPKSVRTDNGKSFVAGKKIVAKTKEELDMQADLEQVDWTEVSTRTKIDSWTFAPPYGPEMNGSAEAFVKLAKTRLNKTLRTHQFNADQLRTTLAYIINSINSRPLAYITSSVEESVVLYINRYLKAGITPTGGLLDDMDTVGGRYARQWTLVKIVVKEFWIRWRQEVLMRLISYEKWRQWKKNVEKGQLVMVFDPESKQNDWPMGVIKEVIRGNDGAVRRVVVTCQLNKGSRPADFERSIRQVVPLDMVCEIGEEAAVAAETNQTILQGTTSPELVGLDFSDLDLSEADKLIGLQTA
jgi:transposase